MWRVVLKTGNYLNVSFGVSKTCVFPQKKSPSVIFFSGRELLILSKELILPLSVTLGVPSKKAVLILGGSF